MKRLILALAECLMFFSCVLCAPSGLAAKTPKPTNTPMPTIAPLQEVWPEMPPLTEDGYLQDEGGQAEFVHADVENGLWLYISKGLRVQIKRYNDPNIPLIWYEADIRTRGEELFHSVPADADRVGSVLDKPEAIARRSRAVFGINDDQFIERKKDKVVIGTVVRNGKIYGTSSLRSGGLGYPNLETLAVFPDGSIKVFQSKEYTSQEYLDMGATDVYAFGPILIRDGTINQAISKYSKTSQPRCALGMVEPCHYVAVVADGRHKGSEGVSLEWLAGRMHALGAVQALNLDGGNTSAMVFMGERLNSSSGYGPDGNVRSIGGLIAIGTSDLVPEYQP